MTPRSLQTRAEFYNAAYNHLCPLVVHYNAAHKPFLYGHWFLGGRQNSNDFYGTYQTEYLARIETLFPDAENIVHIFSGALPPSPRYVRVGIDPTGKNTADIQGDVQSLSSFLPLELRTRGRNPKPDLIYADPPYTATEAENNYRIAMVNRSRVLSECSAVLQPGGFLVWLDQALPVFSNDELSWVGSINYIRSTGNRFRTVCLFQKPI